MIRSELIATFVQIVDLGSLNAAARNLGLSRSVISERLKALEADLGAPLLVRSTHGLSLTRSGETFLEHARSLMSAMDNARNAVAESGGLVTGRLRIASPSALTNVWLTPLFAQFLKLHPGVSLEISASDRTVDLAQDGFDLAIRSARHRDSALMSRKLTSSRRVVVCSPDYRARHGVPKSLNDFADHHFVVYRNTRITQDWTFRTDTGLRSARIGGRFEADDGLVLRRAVLAGTGLCLLPTFMVSEDLISGALIKVDLGIEPDIDTISAVYPKTSATIPRLQGFVDYLRQSLGDPSPWDRDLATAGFSAQ